MSLDLDRSTWQRVKFGDLVRNVNENVKDPDSAGIDRAIGLEHLDPGELRIDRWGELTEETTFTRRVKPGQTLFGKRRAYQRKTAYTEFDAVCSGDILVFESADPQVLLPELLPFIAMTDGFYAKALETSAGSLSPRTRWSDLATYEFNLPPLTDQRRIADLLWTQEQTRRSIEVVQATTELTTGRWLDVSLQSLVRLHPETVGDALSHNMIRLQTGPFGTALSSREFTSGGTPVIHPTHIRNGGIYADWDSTLGPDVVGRVAKWRVLEGDIVFMRKGDVGRSAIVTGDQAGWVLSSDCISLRVLEPKVLQSGFIQGIFSAPIQQAELLRRAPGTTMPGINEKSLAQMPLPRPSLEVQQAFSYRLSEMGHVLARMKQEAESLARMRESILKNVWG